MGAPSCLRTLQDPNPGIRSGMASDGTIHSETVPFGDLIAAYALFEKACVDSRRAYCECKQKTPAPFACQDYARVVKKDYEKQ